MPRHCTPKACRITRLKKSRAHQSKKQRDEETLKQASARERNEEA